MRQSGTPLGGMKMIESIRGQGRALRASLGAALVGLGTRLGGVAPENPETATPGNARTTRADETEKGSDRFASLTSMIPGVVYQRIVRPDGDIRYTYISEGAQEMFGVAAEEILKDPEALFRTYSDDYKAHFRQRLVAASKTLTKWDVEASIVTRDGRIKYTHAIATPEALPDGSVLWTGLILDATRIKLVEEELKAANRSVQAANRGKSMFLANMSHEIRTPMNGVLGMADLLFKTELSPRQDRLLTTLKHSAKTLLAIINDVLDISRIESGRFELERESFCMLGCLEDVVELCATSAYQKGLELNLMVEPGLPRIVVGDAGRLRQVLVNLIGNAVKFTEAGEVAIRVSAKDAGEGRQSVAVEVRDTGIGIAPEARKRLFSPFSQADTSISRRFGGTGLGLAITHHLIQLMGGKIDLKSELGRGTTIRFEIPFEVACAQAAAGTEAEMPLVGWRILVVDDRASVRETLSLQLASTGAQIVEAVSEGDALEKLRHAAANGSAFNTAIIDRVRPNVGSLDLCRIIRKDSALAATAIVSIMSINWRADHEAKPADPKGSVTLSKPVRRTELINAICGSAAAEAARTMRASQITREEAEAKSSQPNLGMRVLLAEDNPVNQEVAREYLSLFGCEVELAENGQEAIDLLERGSFDIVLMYCQMPLLDGLSATRRIRENERREGKQPVPIVAVTANAFDSDRVAAQEAGMDDFLTKPFTDEQLGKTLARWHKVMASRSAA